MPTPCPICKGSATTNDGDFPCPSCDGLGEVPTRPKTLRDQFAMAALAGFAANDDLCPSSMPENAKKMYRWADAMLAAREAKL